MSLTSSSLRWIISIKSFQGVPDFEWQPVVASNISHLNIGNQMDMDQVTVINIAILALFIITKMNKYIGDDSGPPQPSPC